VVISLLQKVNNSTVEGLNDSEMNEILTRELKRVMARMYNHLNKFKENKSIQINELRKN
jgi:hypothetical protein